MEAPRIFASELIPPRRNIRQRHRLKRVASNSLKSSCSGGSSSLAKLDRSAPSRRWRGRPFRDSGNSIPRKGARRPDRQLHDLLLFNDLPEVRCQLAIVTGKNIVEGPLGTVLCLLGPVFVLGGFALVLFNFGLKIDPHDATPRNSALPSKVAWHAHPFEKMAPPRRFCSAWDQDRRDHRRCP
jgi:hypothetical protein